MRIGNFVAGDMWSCDVIEKAPYKGGEVFLDTDAFERDGNEVCYVPSFSDKAYTRNDLIHICGSYSKAKECLENVGCGIPECWSGLTNINTPGRTYLGVKRNHDRVFY